MDTIHHLRAVLHRTLHQQEHQNDEKILFDELMVHKPRLLKILYVDPRSPQEQREIQSGKLVIKGKNVTVNTDFVKQVLFLAQQLDCSEKYIAELLHDVTAKNPNAGAINCMELVVTSYHQRRRDLVHSVRLLFEAAETTLLPNRPQIYTRLAKFAEMDLLLGIGGAGTQISFVQRVFEQFARLDDVLEKADVARKSALSYSSYPGGGGQPSLGLEVLNGRYDSLQHEQRSLAIILCSIARLGQMPPKEVKLVMEWLFANPNHPMTYYVLTTILLAFDPIDPLNPKTEYRLILATDPSSVAYLTKKFEPSTQWKDPGLKATILLKWTMFMTEVRHHDSTLEHKSGFKTEELEAQVWNAVQGDVFPYLLRCLEFLEGKSISASTFSSLSNTSSDQQSQREMPTSDIKVIILSAFESLVRSLVTHASSELRKIKQRQEDLVLANARTDRKRTVPHFATSKSTQPEKSEPPRHDIALLYSFIGSLYSTLPEERALQFWGSGPQHPNYQASYQETVEATTGRLPAFLQWAVWSTPTQDFAMMAALYNMINGLANGQQCSELAYNFLARGGGEVLAGSSLSVSSSSGPSVSWTVIFGLLESWSISASNPRTQPDAAIGQNSSFSGLSQSHALPQRTSQQFVIGSNDICLAKAFLQLLSTVVKHSVVVRTTIWGHAHFRAISTLLSLIPLGIPLELKGAIFETLAAFCQPGAGAAGVDICRTVWTLMERLEVINVRMGPSGLATGRGVEVELEQVESASHTYPATIPFLKLLVSLIHTPKQLPLQELAAGVEPLNTIPETLGQPYRLPGISPFTSFVIDTVFVNIPRRDYANISDRWLTNDLCLAFIERCLASFTLESLVTGSDDPAVKTESLISLLIHPGYEIMKRLLTASPLHTTILSYITNGLEGFEKGVAEGDLSYRNTVVRVLRIIYRVLEIQDLFLDVYLPLLSDLNVSESFGHVNSRSFFTKLDQSLSFDPNYIPALAGYMFHASHPELVLLSIKIISKLSLSVSPSTLVTLIERSSDSERILQGFMQTLSRDSTDDVVQAEEFAEQNTGAGAPAMDLVSGSLEQAIRLVALDLLIQDTDAFRPYPNIAHFFLFGIKSADQIHDPHALGARQTCVHILLDLVNNGVPRLKGKRREHYSYQVAELQPLFYSLPGLAERCYRIIYQLCIHPKTSDFTARYLRSREDFYARQIARVTPFAPPTFEEPPIQLQYYDGSLVKTTVASLNSFLRLRSYIFDLVALELHVLTTKGHHKAVSELLEILFGTDFAFEEEHDFQVFHEIGQSPIRIIDFLRSLLFDWADSIVVETRELNHLKQLSLQSCIRRDSSGCEVVDRTALLYLVMAARRNFKAQGTVAIPAQYKALDEEINYVLNSCAVENHRRKISHARVLAFESWRRLLDLALTKCFDRLPHDRRESMIFDLLHVLPSAIRSGKIEDVTAILLSETVLLSITKLREDRQYQVMLQSLQGDFNSSSLPAERLFNILRDILECIIESNHIEFVRGNLYAALINFLHLVKSSSSAKPHTESESNPFAVSLISSKMSNSIALRKSTLSPFSECPPSNSVIELGCLSSIKGVMERLVMSIARDAIDGTEVWKTVAFMLLDSLVLLSSLEKQHVALSALSRHGILSNFVRSIKDSDSILQDVLKPEPDDLNSLYVYESKMSLFIRMAQTRAGAERLLDAQLFPILSQCDYLDTRPEVDQSFIDHGSLLPPAIQRYHQLVMPALQLIDVMLATLGSGHATALDHALQFLSSHGPTIAILLKNQMELVSLSILEEIHLIVTLCTNILPSVPKDDVLKTSTGFGSIHVGILGLATWWLARPHTTGQILPQTEVDFKLSKAYAFGFGTQSKFDLKVQRREMLLRKSIISYIGACSEFTDLDITLVLSPVTNTSRNEERTSHFAASVPSVGDAIVALDDLCNELGQTLQRISNMSAELANKERIGLDGNEEILRDINPVILRDLEIEQRRALLCDELEKIREAAKLDAKMLLDTVEMLLLVICRHVDYYADPRHMNMPPAKTTILNAMRLLATSEPQVFQGEVAGKIQPILQRIVMFELAAESFGREWQDSQAFLRILIKRLSESAGLVDDSSSTNNENDQTMYL